MRRHPIQGSGRLKYAPAPQLGARQSRRDVLLSVYAVERAYSVSQLQIQLAIITAGITYVIAASGLIATKCLEHSRGRSFLPAGGHGCQSVPHAVLWGAPLPVIGLLGFLTLTQTLLDFHGAYVSSIERELLALSEGRQGDLAVPQNFQTVIRRAYRRLPSLLGPIIAYLSVSAIVVGFLVLMLELMPWTGQGETVTRIVCGVYVLCYVLLGAAFLATTRRLLPRWSWGRQLHRHAGD